MKKSCNHFRNKTKPTNIAITTPNIWKSYKMIKISNKNIGLERTRQNFHYIEIHENQEKTVRICKGVRQVCQKYDYIIKNQ